MSDDHPWNPELVDRLRYRRNLIELYGACDSCLEPLGPDDVNRYRHATCQPPAPGPAKLAATAAADRLRDSSVR